MPCDAEETPYDDEDGDCDPSTPDFDLDGDGDNAQSARIRAGTDCDDNDPRTHPAAPEVCADGKDNNCDGRVDEPACADREAPAVRFGSPAAGLAYAGTLEVVVEAQDDTSIAQVRLFGPGGQVLGTSSNVPARFMVDTTRLSDGPVTLAAEAQDVADRRTRASLAIVIDNRTPPEMTILSPLEGESYVGVMQLEVQAIDASPVRDVSISVDGDQPVVLNIPPYVRLVDTAALSEGPHRATLVASDLRGNSVSRQVSFFVDRTPPRLAVAMPTDGARVNGTFEVYIEADDPTPGAGLRQLVSTPGALGPRVTSDRRLRYSIDTVALRISNGPFVIRTTAVDWARGPAGAQGNTTALELSLVIDNTNVTADAGVAFDAGDPPDVGVPDTGAPDVGVPDTGVPNAGSDAGAQDASGRPDAGAIDSGTTTPFVEQIDISPDGVQAWREIDLAGISADGRRIGMIVNGFYGSQVHSEDLWMRDRRIGFSTCWTPVPYDGWVSNALLSASGEAAVFKSPAPIDPSDMNGQRDLYVRHPDGRFSLISIGSDGTRLSRDRLLTAKAITENGRFVLFDSEEALVPDDTNDVADAYLRDTVLDTTERVSLTATGAQTDYASHGLSISDDGRFVAFFTSIASMDPGMLIGGRVLFVRDRQAGTTLYVSLSAEIHYGLAGDITEARLTPDGRSIIFLLREAPNHGSGVFSYDLTTGTTEIIFRGNFGEYIEPRTLDISADGRHLVFVSRAALIPQDTNGEGDVYVWDRARSLLARANNSATGTQDIGHCSNPRISRDGTRIVYQSKAPIFQNSFDHPHIFAVPNILANATPDAGFRFDGGHFPDGGVDAGAPDAGVPDAGGVDSGPRNWDVFDPREVYIWGQNIPRFRGGIAHWARPTEISVGIDHRPAQGSEFIGANGELVYVTQLPYTLRTFRCDPAQDCGAYSTQLNSRVFPIYPTSPEVNDPTLNTGVCMDGIAWDRFWGGPDGRIVFRCYDLSNSAFYDVTGNQVTLPPEMNTIVALGHQGSILGINGRLGNLVVWTPSHGPHPVIPDIVRSDRILASRSTSDGFLVVQASDNNEDDLYLINNATGVVSLLGSFPPLPGHVSIGDRQGALDASQNFFQVVREPGDWALSGVVVRRDLNGTSEIVYRSREQYIPVESGRTNLITGP